MPITQNYVDPVGGLDANPGTLAQPWQTLQHAFDTCVRNVADGNQINLKSSGPHVNAASLSLAIFIAAGALSGTAPLIVRGYTAAANDGGVGEIDCNGATMWAATTYDYVILVDLEIHTFGDNHGIVLDTYCTLFRCEIHKGVSAPVNRRMVALGNICNILGCYLHDAGDGTSVGIYITGHAVVYGNYVVVGAGATGVGIRDSSISQVLIASNAVLCSRAGQIGIWHAGNARVIHNAIYNSAAGTFAGIYSTNSTLISVVMNNVVEGWSGVGGRGVLGLDMGPLGYNGFYNNTAPNAITDQTFIDLTANDVNSAAFGGVSPFTNAAAGDFSLTAAAKALLRGVGWPAAYLGAHANTDGHITIGPIQYGPAVASGAVVISPYRGNL